MKTSQHTLIGNGRLLKRIDFMPLQPRRNKNGKKIGLRSITNIKIIIKKSLTTYKRRSSVFTRRRLSTVGQIFTYTGAARPPLAQKAYIQLSKPN